jgi:hypothetical protein
MDKNLEDQFDIVEKSLRPEVSREQLYALVEALTEAIESVIEMPEEDSEDQETMESPETEIEDVYKSDNEEEDKWDNIEKACWTGYTQRGMKEKNGRMVPNCVPVEKVEKSLWSGSFDPKNIKL